MLAYIAYMYLYIILAMGQNTFCACFKLLLLLRG